MATVSVARQRAATVLFFGASALFWPWAAPADKAGGKDVLRGRAAFTDYRKEQPGVFRLITSQDLPMPYETNSARNYPKLVPRPTTAWPQAPAGFKVKLYVGGLDQPRLIRTAPNGDLFVAESHAGEVKVFRGITAKGEPEQTSVFASGLHQPFGIAFYPPGGNPRWVYVANTDSVLRFPYKTGELKASGPAVVLAHLPSGGGHITRDVAFSRDGKRMFVSVGSSSNVADPRTRPADRYRANILEYTSEGSLVKVYASGIRNPVGLAVHPLTGELWCSTNERDGLGDNLVPDYITHVQEGGFYGWPWYYIGAHEDPRREGERPGLKNTVLAPDVLVQAHSASLEMVFYNGNQFPDEYSEDIFAAEHGSWNKTLRAGYEVIRVPLDKGRAPGEYEDFLTGFVTPEGNVWGRPVGVAVAQDGSLMVTDDGSKSIWRVSYVRPLPRRSYAR